MIRVGLRWPDVVEAMVANEFSAAVIREALLANGVAPSEARALVGAYVPADVLEMLFPPK